MANGTIEKQLRGETEGQMKDVDYDRKAKPPVTRQTHRDAAHYEFAQLGQTLSHIGERAAANGHLTDTERTMIGKKVGQMVRESKEIANSIGEQTASEQATASGK